MHALTEMICTHYTDYELSSIAIDTYKKIIRATIAKDIGNEIDSHDLKNISVKFDPIIILQDTLDKKHFKKTQVNKTVFYHLFMTGILKKYSGNNIEKELIKNSIKSAKKLEYSKVIEEATRPVSQNVTIKNMGSNL